MKVMRIVVQFCSAALLLGAASSAVAAMPTTGKCGFVMNIPNPELNFGKDWGTNGPTNVTLDVLGEVDFAASTISFTPTRISWNNVSGGWSIDPQVGVSGTFTAAQSTLQAGESVLVFTFNGNQTMTFNALPTNSGKTILLQGVNKKVTGVCQME